MRSRESTITAVITSNRQNENQLEEGGGVERCPRFLFDYGRCPICVTIF